MGKKEHNPDKFFDKFKVLQREALESEENVSYDFVRYDGDDADGQPIWSSRNAESEFRNGLEGRYGIWREKDGEGECIKETTITGEGERAMARRVGSNRRGGDDMSAAAIGRGISSLNEAFQGIIARESKNAVDYQEKYLQAREELLEVKEANIKLKAALEADEDMPDALLKIFEMGSALFTGHATRKWLAKKLGEGTVMARIAEAIGPQNAAKVANIIASEFNENPPAGFLSEGDESEEESEEAH